MSTVDVLTCNHQQFLANLQPSVVYKLTYNTTISSLHQLSVVYMSTYNHQHVVYMPTCNHHQFTCQIAYYFVTYILSYSCSYTCIPSRFRKTTGTPLQAMCNSYMIHTTIAVYSPEANSSSFGRLGGVQSLLQLIQTPTLCTPARLQAIVSLGHCTDNCGEYHDMI